MALPYQAVLLIAFGGPTCREEIHPFLARVTKGMPIPPARLEEVAHHYEAVGGKSPLNEITQLQAEALQAQLHARGIKLPVYVGYRNAQPFFTETLQHMTSNGISRALGLILSSHHTEASWERYQQNIADSRTALHSEAPVVDYCGGWHDHPLFIETWVEHINAACNQLPRDKRIQTPLVFTAHSIPTAMATRSRYVEQLETSARMIAGALHLQNWSIAYQSRSGRPSDPWLEPDVNEVIRKHAAEGCKTLAVAPIGFVCDHVEVLYDLDIEAKKIADGLGVDLRRASCPNGHPTFIRMMAEVICERL